MSTEKPIWLRDGDIIKPNVPLLELEREKNVNGVEHEPESVSTQSNLPSWILDMRNNLNKSKANLTHATGRISEVEKNVETLGYAIDKMMGSPRTRAREKAKRNFDASLKRRRQLLEDAGLSHTEMNMDDHNFVNEIDVSSSSYAKDNRISFADIVIADPWGIIVSFLTPWQVLQIEQVSKEIREIHQQGYFFRDLNLFPYHIYRGGEGDFRSCIKSRLRCRSFIRRSKQHNAVNKSERLEQLKNMFEVSCLALAKDTSSFEFLNHPDTCSILVALLTNENASIRDLSCGILANLICFYKMQKYRNNMTNTNTDTSTIPDTKAIDIQGQFIAANGPRKVLSLLISPSASVILAYSHGANNHERNNSIRSICSKRGARSLVNIFSDDSPVPENFHPEKEILPGHTLSYLFTFWHKSGTLKENYVAEFHVGEDGVIEGGGVDSVGVMEYTGKVVQDIDGQCFLFKTNTLGNNRPYLNCVGYWNNGVTNEVGELYGQGFFGIWENYTAEPQFELKKGGVWRGVPLL